MGDCCETIQATDVEVVSQGILAHAALLLQNYEVLEGLKMAWERVMIFEALTNTKTNRSRLGSSSSNQN